MKTHLFVGSHKGLLIFERRTDGLRFVREAFAGARVPFAARDSRTGVVWALIKHEHWGCKLHRSRDLGVTWDEVATPAYPDGELTPRGKPATLSYLWVYAEGAPSQPQRSYIGTIPGGLFVSNDGGDSWQLNRGLWDQPSRRNPEAWFGGGFDEAGVDALLVDPRDPKHLYASISVAGIFESRDDGATWVPANRGLEANYLPKPDVEVGHDPHFTAMSPANPDVLWQQNHCGVFVSSDGARSWRNVSRADGLPRFGFAIATDRRDARRAYTVPGVEDDMRVPVNRALVVCRTDDGGVTWTTLRSGLPQHNAYDQVFRHGMDCDDDTVVFGTTSGNLYFSQHRGDHWLMQGGSWPLIYSVRFG